LGYDLSSTFFATFILRNYIFTLKKEAANSSETVVPLYKKHVIFPKVITMILP
jgi:hypothetical protein